MGKENNSHGLVVWGKNALKEILRSEKRIERVYLQYGKYIDPELLDILSKRGIKFQWTKKQHLKRLSGTDKHQGIVVLVSPIEYVDYSEILRESLLRKSFFVFLDGITESQNVGVIARNVEFFGGVGIILPEKGASPINETVVKSSSGAIFHLKISKVEFPTEVLKEFKSRGGKVYSIETDGSNIYSAEFQFPSAFVFGSEGKGIAKSILDLSDGIFEIERWGSVSSLNVAVASGIALWWANIKGRK